MVENAPRVVSGHGTPAYTGLQPSTFHSEGYCAIQYITITWKVILSQQIN